MVKQLDELLNFWERERKLREKERRLKYNTPGIDWGRILVGLILFLLSAYWFGKNLCYHIYYPDGKKIPRCTAHVSRTFRPWDVWMWARGSR